MAYDRSRRLWKGAGWAWPDELATLRGNGKAAAAPLGVRAFSDQEIYYLREAINSSARLSPAALLGLELQRKGAVLLAVVSRTKRSSRGSSGTRNVPTVHPSGWPVDCHGHLERCKRCGLPLGLLAARSPGQTMTQLLRRVHMPNDLTSYGLRHAFGLRLGLDLGLHVTEAAELMKHSPAVHLCTYGRRFDGAGAVDQGARAGKNERRGLINSSVRSCVLVGNGILPKKRFLFYSITTAIRTLD
jgi:hypothetical protein